MIQIGEKGGTEELAFVLFRSTTEVGEKRKPTPRARESRAVAFSNTKTAVISIPGARSR